MLQEVLGVERRQEVFDLGSIAPPMGKRERVLDRSLVNVYCIYGVGAVESCVTYIISTLAQLVPITVIESLSSGFKGRSRSIS